MKGRPRLIVARPSEYTERHAEGFPDAGGEECRTPELIAAL
jgi:hypothetical protein